LYVDGSPDKKINSKDIVNEIEDRVRTKISLRDSVEIIARS
jgi:hypothetical protein